MNWENIKILYTKSNYRKRSIAEIIEMKKQKSNALYKMTDLKFFPPAYESIVHKI